MYEVVDASGPRVVHYTLGMPNAPGPASQDAIAALAKKILDEELLGPEGKRESVYAWMASLHHDSKALPPMPNKV
ncbi:hypothetical protein DL98DRAFT_521981, partial [Cadophora sp. DSE1049]